MAVVLVLLPQLVVLVLVLVVMVMVKCGLLELGVLGSARLHLSATISYDVDVRCSTHSSRLALCAFAVLPRVLLSCLVFYLMFGVLATVLPRI